MLAYKGFEKGLICRGYQFQMGLYVTDKANCAANGFHCAEDPLDCLTYYPDMENSVYCLVDAGGDVDEDGCDSKISCTELTVITQLSRENFFLHALAYMVDHPSREWNGNVRDGYTAASRGYAVVRGIDPIAKGKRGDILAFAKESADGKKILQIAIAVVDGEKIMPDAWYGADLKRREAA